MKTFGQEFLGIKTENCDGLFHRVSGVNRLYYTKHFALAEEILSTLSDEGVEALRTKAPEGSDLYEVWNDMSRVGFFWNAPSAPPFAVAWAINANATMSLTEQLHIYEPAIAAFNPNSPQFHLYAREAAAITDACQAIAGDFPLRPLWGPEDRTGSAIRVFSSLLGDESSVPHLIQFLEETDTRLVFETSINETDAENPVLRLLEEEGFLPAYQVSLDVETMLDPIRRETAVQWITKRLVTQPNREIILHDQHPHGLDASDQIHAYFDGLEHLLEMMLEIDGDVSRLSPVQRALNCLLRSRNMDNVFEGWIIDGALHFHHAWDGDCIGAMDPTPEAAETFFRRVAQLTQSPMESVNSNDTSPYSRFQPLRIPTLLHESSNTKSQFIDLIDERRSRIWDMIFKHILTEFIQISRENVELGTPLKLDITADRQAVYSPLYPRSANNVSDPLSVGAA